jgi:thiamine biosynthesis protein ThiI
MRSRPQRELIIKYGELWLKGRNRSKYINLLKASLQERLSIAGSFSLIDYGDRLAVPLKREDDSRALKGIISKVFGISAYSIANVSEPDVESISKVAGEIAGGALKGIRVRVDAHRSFKGHAFDSSEIVMAVAESIQKAGAVPDPRNYNAVISISVTKEKAFVSIENNQGLGGLPLGSSGKAVMLLSGGIDSPVSAWYGIKRGLYPIYVHVHAFSTNSEAKDSKIMDILDRLSDYAPHYSAYLIPSHEFDLSTMAAGKYKTVLLKSFMMNSAQIIAQKHGAKAIVTGESLGQVASQTSSNIMAEQYGISIPIFRPLIGFDKEEIISKARAINTFDLSILKYKDVCSINSRKVSTSVPISIFARMLARTKIGEIAAKAVEKGELIQK